jgi:hypothetical protein
VLAATSSGRLRFRPQRALATGAALSFCLVRASVRSRAPISPRGQFNHAQYPTVEMSGQEFPLTQVR